MVYRIHRRCGQSVGRLRVVFCCNIRDEPEESVLREWREEKKKSVCSLSGLLHKNSLKIVVNKWFQDALQKNETRILIHTVGLKYIVVR